MQLFLSTRPSSAVTCMSTSLVSTLVKAAFKAATGTIHRILTPKSEHKQAKVTKYKQPIHDWTMYQHLTTTATVSSN